MRVGRVRTPLVGKAKAFRAACLGVPGGRVIAFAGLGAVPAVLVAGVIRTVGLRTAYDVLLVGSSLGTGSCVGAALLGLAVSIVVIRTLASLAVAGAPAGRVLLAVPSVI